MKIKVGDYVRTKNLGGSIEKIIEIMPKEKTPDLKTRYTTDISSLYSSRIIEDEIIKSSPNIIDLIEVGDMVNYEQLNGGVVLNKKDNEIDTWSILPNTLKNEDIKSVITREQMQDMEYKIER